MTHPIQSQTGRFRPNLGTPTPTAQIGPLQENRISFVPDKIAFPIALSVSDFFYGTHFHHHLGPTFSLFLHLHVFEPETS